MSLIYKSGSVSLEERAKKTTRSLINKLNNADFDRLWLSKELIRKSYWEILSLLLETRPTRILNETSLATHFEGIRNEIPALMQTVCDDVNDFGFYKFFNQVLLVVEEFEARRMLMNLLELHGNKDDYFEFMRAIGDSLDKMPILQEALSHFIKRECINLYRTDSSHLPLPFLQRERELCNLNLNDAEVLKLFNKIIALLNSYNEISFLLMHLEDVVKLIDLACCLSINCLFSKFNHF